MGQAFAEDHRKVVEDLIQALGDDVRPESQAWWHYVFAVKELGADVARQLVGDAHAVEAKGGMMTKDRSRRRTPGGVFFALAEQKLGPERWRSLRGHAQGHSDEAIVRRFLKLLALFVPSASTDAVTGSAPSTAGLIPPSTVASSSAATAPETTAPGARAATVVVAAFPSEPVRGRGSKPTRRPESEVEVLVVRRRAPSA